MSNTMTENAVGTEFGVEELKANAKSYREHKAVVDAIAKGIAKAKGGYDNLEDAIAQVRAVWAALEKQVVEGASYTPPTALGFGSSNAGQIASSLTGQNSSVTELRRAFSNLGK